MKSRIKTDLLSWLDFICRSSGILLCWVGLSFSSAQAATDYTQVTQIPQAECETLVALYKSTDGPNWSDSPSNNWNITNEPCQWTGITCGDGHVAKIDRGRRRLVGTLPDLSNLIFLQFLNLSGEFYFPKKLTGPLPNLSALTKLTFLSLDNNQFTGTLNILFFPSSLQSLNLNSNQLEGPIPNFKERFPNLVSIDLGEFDRITSKINSLTGPIDASYFPISLQSLVLSDNPLKQSLPNFSSLINLTKLHLSRTQLTGSINLSFFPSSLQSLDLSSNQLEENIPNFSKLNNLTELSLGGNRLVATPI